MGLNTDVRSLQHPQQQPSQTFTLLSTQCNGDGSATRKISLGNWVSCVAIAASKQSGATKARLLRETSRHPRVQTAT
jgi:hypothetical protein